MSAVDKILEQMRTEPANVRFADLRFVCDFFWKTQAARQQSRYLQDTLARKSKSEYSKRQGQSKGLPSPASFTCY